MSTVIIFAGGECPPSSVLGDLPEADLAVAANGGYDIAIALGHVVDAVVGDLDSIEQTELPRHVIVERHPRDKEATDLELAMEMVARDSPARLVVVGATGGRIDHELSAAMLICSPRWAMIDEIDWVSGRGRAHVVRGHRRLHGDVGATVSLLPIGGDAAGVTTHGLEWELAGEDLPFGTSRGVSNRILSPVIDVKVESGVLLALFPYA